MIPLSDSPTPLLVTWLVHSSLCLALCWALERAGLVRSLRAREYLWRAALLGSCATAALRTLGLPSFEVAGEPELGLARLLASAPPATLSAPTSFSPTPPGIEGLSRALDLACLVWAVGAALGLLRLAAVGLRTSGLARRARRASPALLARWRALCARQGVRASELSLSDELSGPVSLPSRAVLVPPWVEELEPRQQDALLAHELAHGERRDPLWHLGARVLSTLLWPQPLVHCARRRLEALAEFAADRWAVAAGAEGRALAECLLACAERPRGARPLASALEGSSALPERIEQLLAPPAPNRLTLGLCTAAWLGLVLVGAGAPGCDRAGPRNGSRTSVFYDSDGTTEVEIQRGGDRLTLASDVFVLRDDLGGVSTLQPDGRFTLTLLERGERTTYRAEQNAAGLHEEFERNGSPVPLDATARTWITTTLERIARESSFDPRGRTTSAVR